MTGWTGTRCAVGALLVMTLVLSACGRGDKSDDEAVSRAGIGQFTNADFECLREAIYFEALPQSAKGQRAVADVILNRADDPRFPDTICGVIAEGQDRGRCQFSYRCDGRAENFPDVIKFDSSSRAAREALQNPDADITNGALYFHTTGMNPGWFASLDRTGEFGGHYFYTARGH